MDTLYIIKDYIDTFSLNKCLMYASKIPLPQFVADLGQIYVVLYFAVSGLLLSYILRRVFVLQYTLFFMREKNILKRYGRDGWAQVTGATDGLGWEFCKLLAKRGFKIILVSRSHDRIEGRIQELNELYKSIKNKKEKLSNSIIKANSQRKRFTGVVADFSQGYTESFYENLKNQIENYNISLLVNNVGINNKGENIDDCIQLINVNTLSQVMLIKMLLPNFQRRSLDLDKRSGIINVSSIKAKLPMTHRTLYGATKSFNEYFSEGFNLKNKDKYDVLTVTPWFVSTPMLNYKKLSWSTCTPLETAEGSQTALCNLERTYGSTKHILTGFQIDSLISLGLERQANAWFSWIYRNQV